MKPTLSKIPFGGPLRGPQKGILLSVVFIWEANQPDYLIPGSQNKKQINPFWLLDLNSLDLDASYFLLDPKYECLLIWTHAETYGAGIRRGGAAHARVGPERQE